MNFVWKNPCKRIGIFFVHVRLFAVVTMPRVAAATAVAVVALMDSHFNSTQFLTFFPVLSNEFSTISTSLRLIFAHNQKLSHSLTWVQNHVSIQVYNLNMINIWVEICYFQCSASGKCIEIGQPNHTTIILKKKNDHFIFVFFSSENLPR